MRSFTGETCILGGGGTLLCSVIAQPRMGLRKVSTASQVLGSFLGKLAPCRLQRGEAAVAHCRSGQLRQLLAWSSPVKRSTAGTLGAFTSSVDSTNRLAHNAICTAQWGRQAGAQQTGQ